MLVANEAAKGHALEGAIRYVAIHLTRRDEAWQDRFSEAEEAQKYGIPLERADIEQKRTRRIRHFADVLTGTHATKQVLSRLSIVGVG